MATKVKKDFRHWLDLEPALEAGEARRKEMEDKLAWAVGSVYGLPYGRQTKLRSWAGRMASALSKGYEAQIGDREPIHWP